MQLTIGADPEFFVRRKNHYISGHIFECGTKQKPVRTLHGSIQVDGIALEANVTPAATAEKFVANLRGVMRDLRTFVSVVDNDATLVVKPSIFFGHKRLKELPPEISALGCQPDYDAYTGRMNKRPNANLPIRTGSGHIHIGWTENQNPREIRHFKHCCRLVKQLDYFLGLPSLLWDDDSRRRVLYGSAGAFRPKPYGLEYRVLSNKWVETDKLAEWVFNRAVAAVKALEEDAIDMDEIFSGAAKTIVETNNRDWPNKYPGIAATVLQP